MPPGGEFPPAGPVYAVRPEGKAFAGDRRRWEQTGLPNIGGLVCDLDGVVYRGDVPIPGVPAAIRRLRAAGVRVIFCTNNSASTVEQYRDKLARLDVPTEADEVLTSAVVTGETLAASGYTGARALLIGGEGLAAALRANGVGVSEPGEDEPVDVVVVGLDTAFDYDSLRRALLALDGGAVLFASNDDATYPAPHGMRWPGAGSILAAVETASGARARVMGKPHAPMMDAAERRLAGVRPVAVVGDREETDLRGGAARGWIRVLVLSGVTSAEQAAALEPPPDLVLPSLAELAPRP
jgi:HAD superfamily hydrolase (TIGR01450 family)